MSRGFSLTRLWALCRKETLQILRDPSSKVVAFVLPVVMILIFGWGINLDSASVRVGLVIEDYSPDASSFADALLRSPSLRVSVSRDRKPMADALRAGSVRAFVVIPRDFSGDALRPGKNSEVLVVTDGAEPNTANFAENYVRAILEGWRQQRAAERGERLQPGVIVEPRYWFNPSALSRNYLVPGSITLVMTVIGALLTSLVIAREWERGTMEALLASPVTSAELLLSKVIPYYVLGMISLVICVIVGVLILKVPFRGSFLVLWLAGSLFMASALGLGLLFSTITRNQFNAAMAALNAAFLPAVILSGFIYEIRSMPAPIRLFTYILPARHFVTTLQTLFQAGEIWPVLLRSMLFLAGASVLFLGITAMLTRRRLD